jgi:murein DD-endopeptidase MepM/ murein hydrolase activator NlpD
VKRRVSFALLCCAASAAALPNSADGDAERDTLAAVAAAPLPSTPEGIDRELAAIERDERALRKRLDAAATESELVRGRTIVRGRAYVRAARAGLLPVGAGFQALVEHASKLERLQRALKRDLDRTQELARQRIAIGGQLRALEVRRAPLQVQAQAMTEARTALMSAQDRRLAFERAFEDGDASEHTAIYGSGIGPADPAELLDGFASLKGRLPFPLSGRSEVQTARRADGLGLEMRAPRGTPVRAVHAGRIAFADLYADYGKTIIVDHGQQHYSVSANLEEFSVRVGDDVAAGTRIGSVAARGAGGVLYFEIRIGSENVDPAPWFGI